MEKGTYRCKNFRKNCEYARTHRDIKCLDGTKLTVDGKDFKCPVNHPTCQREIRLLPSGRGVNWLWVSAAAAAIVVAFVISCIIIRPHQATITVVASLASGGTVNGGGTFAVGSQQQISASASSGWTFTGWSDGNTQNPRTITVASGGTTYTADFSQQESQQAATITVAASPASGGTVNGGGTFAVGSQQQISASASSGWTFTGWSDGNTQNPRTITVASGGTTYTADFSQQEATITVVANPASGGTVNEGGTFAVGSQQQISASASSGWTFTGWSDGNTQNPRTITVASGGMTYTADFSSNGGPTCETVLKEVLKLSVQKRYEDALTRWDEAYRICGETAKVWRYKAIVLDDMKRYEEARPAYKKAIAINPQEGDSWFIGAACREAQSHLPGAMYGYRQFLGLTPGPDPRKQTVQRNIERWRQQGIKEDPSDF